MPCPTAAGATRLALLIPALLALAVPAALAQSTAERQRAEEEQRCVWRCLADSPGAHSQQYQSCVQRFCVAPQAAPAPRQSSAPRWTNHAQGNAHSAEVAAGNRRLSVLCSRGGQVLLGLSGFGGRADAVTLTIDGRAHRGSAVTRNGIHYAEASPAILRALMNGRQLQAAAGTGSTGFSLGGSGAAIRAAMSGCGLALR